MKINLKVRLRNPIFWVTVIPAIATFVYALLGAFDIVPSLSQSVVVDILLSIVSALSTVGVLVDPTTSGVGDSNRALSYTVPNKEEEME